MDILIVPKDCEKLTRVTLPSPNDDKPQHYLLDEENLTLYEIVEFSESYRAWFVDNYLCKQGHFNMITRVDPLFVFLPVIIKHAKTQYRPLHDICQEHASNRQAMAAKSSKHGEFSPIDCALYPNISWRSICDTQDIDGDLYLRYSEANTFRWLLDKHDRVMRSLKDEMGDKASKATLMSHASDLLAEYIPESLCQKLREMVREKHTIGTGKK